MTKILLIEDEEDLRISLRMMLEEEDYLVAEASNGKDGVETAKVFMPDLILCDMMMPKMNGYEVLGALHKELKTSTIPFVFLTALNGKTDQRQAMLLGADDYLTKPFTRQEILDAISIRLAKHQSLQNHFQKGMDELRENLARSLPHEFMTPLSVILMASELLLENKATLRVDELEEIGLAINTTGKKLHKLIERFLLFAELESLVRDGTSKFPLEAKKLSTIAGFVSDIANAKAFQMGRWGDLRLVIDINEFDQNLNCCLVDGKFKILLEEILDNSFKYSKPGIEVELLISSSIIRERKNAHYHRQFEFQDSDGEAYKTVLVIQVSDKGRGMTSEQIKKVGAMLQFERQMYEQQGSGLGLAIASRVVDLHSGEMSINSEYGTRTVVRVELPLTVGQPGS